MSNLFAALPVAAALATAGYSDSERCLAARYQLPDRIAEDMRPYLVCGLFARSNGHFDSQTRLNGAEVWIQGPGIRACSRLREDAVMASEARLAPVMPNFAERRAYVQAEFQKADQFLRSAARSGDLAVEDSPTAPNCRNDDAQNR